MCSIQFTNQFKKDLKLAKKQGRDLDKLLNEANAFFLQKKLRF